MTLQLARWRVRLGDYFSIRCILLMGIFEIVRTVNLTRASEGEGSGSDSQGDGFAEVERAQLGPEGDCRSRARPEPDLLRPSGGEVEVVVVRCMALAGQGHGLEEHGRLEGHGESTLRALLDGGGEACGVLEGEVPSQGEVAILRQHLEA